MRFACEQLDQTGLYNLRARAYQPVTGRFLQLDPATGAMGAPAASSYAYANNRPSVLIDPSGMWSIASALTTLGWAKRAAQTYLRVAPPWTWSVSKFKVVSSAFQNFGLLLDGIGASQSAADAIAACYLDSLSRKCTSSLLKLAGHGLDLFASDAAGEDDDYIASQSRQGWRTYTRTTHSRPTK
jgi:RHS repeat-associated protein